MRAVLFETFRLFTPEGQPIDPGSPTTRSLIAYLLLNRSRPADRRKLAFTFWPGASEPAARRNLRQYLHHIRTALAAVDPDGSLLLAEGSAIQINPKAEINLDVARSCMRPVRKPRSQKSSTRFPCTPATCSRISTTTGSFPNGNTCSGSGWRRSIVTVKFCRQRGRSAKRWRPSRPGPMPSLLTRPLSAA